VVIAPLKTTPKHNPKQSGKSSIQIMTTLLLGFALGMRHGTDPDHLAAIDGLSRIRARATNGLFFALGHGLVVTALAVGIGQIVSDRAAFLGPWVLILIGFINLVKLVRRSPQPYATGAIQRPVVLQPFLLGMILAAGFETASQFSMLILAGKTNPWLLGAVFTGGMVLVDGFDGYLAASTQNLAAVNGGSAQNASRLLGILVVSFSFGLGGAELLGFEWDRFAVPLGLALFALVIAMRVWARSGLKPLLKEQALVPSQTILAAQ
jgi:high-affinity nickel-transport protein